MKMSPRTLALCTAALLGLSPLAAFSAAPTPSPVQTEVARLAMLVNGKVGVSPWRLDGQGAQVHLNADEPFPMASTFKVAVAGAVLAKVDAGQLALTTLLPVPKSSYVDSEIIADRFIHEGVSLSVHNLIELMLTQSDNSATDVLVAQAGGPAAVTAWLRAQGIEGQRLDRDTNHLLSDIFGLGEGPLTKERVAELAKDADVAKRGANADFALNADTRDTSTPRAMSSLLTRLFNGKALSPASTEVLVQVMQRCRTCSARLRGSLPPGTVVADKSGTVAGTVNDVGVVTLPDGSRFAISVFVKQSAAPRPERERVIAEIARTVRDFYLLQPKAPAR
ncbi:MAG: Beta-lactamase SHV-1 [Stenotrophomonas maltophilia]|uniref:Beta-lactamase n=1 Tax=Stenotrophomonas maltophilia TaxID=40324 RepID=A0A7V8FJY9_STEMA|nr:MAG: Beta-lactamase SHV-1 [Stenotrophomonas maltophilia]